MKFKERSECIKFALKYCKNFSKKIYFLLIARSLFNAFTPIIPTVFSSLIVGELCGNKNIKKLLMYSALLCVLTALCSLFARIADRAMEFQCDLIHDYEGKIFEEHIVNADYELLEDAEYRQNVKNYRIVYENNYGIYYNMFFFIRQFAEGLIGIIASFAIVYPSMKSCFIGMSKNGASIAVLLITVAVLFVLIFIVSNKYINAVNDGNLRFNTIFSVFKYWFDFPSDYKNGKEIRIYNAKAFIEKKNSEFLKEQYGLWDNIQGIQLKYDRILYALQVLIMASFFLFVGLSAVNGGFSAGSFVLFFGSSANIANGIGFLGRIGLLFGMSAEHISYFKRIVETPPRKVKGTLPVEKRDDNKFDIEFKNVSFKYPGTDKYVLENFNAKLQIGHHIAVVGKNGSGKTTFIKLLCRLYDVDEGEITLNGINIKKYDLSEYKNLFSVVFQDFQLFSVPLAQNVTTSLEHDDGRLYSCLEQAGIKERVMNMPEKENSVIYKDFDENGIEISGGEAQKIALARALYRDAPFVILDEPTSALDPVSEFEIYQRFNSFVGDKTAVYISHRLSSCRFCNEIYVFDGGKIAEQGSHDELLEKNGIYSSLWYAQAKYYN